MILLNALVKQVLEEYATLPTGAGLARRLLISDSGVEFWLYKMGWQENKRIHATTAHIEVIDDKVWIHRDESEEGFAWNLELVGVPKHQIVLAFRHPKQREFSEYAVS
jgi:XisI protein